MENLNDDGKQINENKIIDSIKRNLGGYIEHKGSSKKISGYFSKD